MGFPTKYLNDAEEIVLDLKPHWWFMAASTVSLAVSLVGAVGVLILVHVEQRDVFILGAFVLVMLTSTWFTGRWAVWTTTNLVITTDRLIHRSGVFAKAGREIPLSRINDISFSQSVFERMLGCGDLMIESAGERGQQQFNVFPKPEYVQNQIHRQIELCQSKNAFGGAGRYSGGDGGAAGNGSPPGNASAWGGDARLRPVTQRLADLGNLRDRGIISESDFEARKAQLLDQL